jgi:hypothetical protein
MRKDEDGEEADYPLQVQVSVSIDDLKKSEESAFQTPSFQRCELQDVLKACVENKDSALPAYVQKKGDGVRIQAARKDGKVQLLTEQGLDVTDCLPTITKELGSLNPSHDFTFNAEAEIWCGSQRLPREEMLKSLTSEGESSDDSVVLNVLDATRCQDDLQGKTFAERRKALAGFSFRQATLASAKPGLNRAPSLLVTTPTEVEEAVLMMKRLPGSEGAVIIKADSKHTSDELTVVQNTTNIRGVVVGRTLLKGESRGWEYHVGVRTGDLTVVDGFEIEGVGTVVKIGSATSEHDIRQGEGILVEADLVDLEHRPEGVVLTARTLKTIGACADQPDDIATVARVAKNDSVLLEKRLDILGSTQYFTQVEKQDQFLVIPPENQKYPYVVQQHWRGKSVHSDLRIGYKPGKLLIGWTLNTAIPGVIKEPVTTLAEARKVAREKMDEYSKVNWSNGEWALRDKRGVEKPSRTSVLAEQKKVQAPWAWLSVEGVTKMPEEGEALPVGGTKNFPGVFQIVDRGDLEFGAQKSWFHEYFVNGDGMNYRILFRQLKLAAETLPPSESNGEESEGGSWLFMRPESQTPYVLEKEAVDKGWMPPPGVSALPEAVRSQVPNHYQYWMISNQAKAKMTRDYLVDAIAKKEVDLNFEAPYKKSVSKASTEAEEKNVEFNSRIRFGMPIAKVDKDKQLVTGIVLEPDTVDAQGDTIDREAIERAAHNFLAKYNRETEMGLLHQVFGEIGVELVESYLAPIDLEIGGQSVKEGTWLMTVRVKDEKLWKKIKSKEITGFSIGGVAAVV